jgi:channel protein (hemolysin III family)
MEAARMLTVAGLSDPVSSVTHLAGALVFASLAIALVRRGRGSAPRLLSLSVFAFSCVLLLSLSGAYHLLAPDSAEKALFKQLDHAAIFLLIAASFTPAHMILFRGAWRWGMLAAVWGAALTGVTLKTVYFDSVPEWLGLTMYLGLGWFGAVSATALARYRSCWAIAGFHQPKSTRAWSSRTCTK